MIVYEYENDSVVAKDLTDVVQSNIVNEISQKWTQWSLPTVSLQSNRDRLVKAATPKMCEVEGKDPDWHSKVELNRPYQYYSKLFGILYETFYDKISSYLKMGKDNFDKVYNRAFNVENKKTLLVCMKDILEYGEIVASAELKNIYKKTTIPVDQLGMVDPSDIVSVSEDVAVIRQKTGEEINFIHINPVNFAYDPLIVPGTKEFDECDKIVKMWKTKQEILTNKSYEISREELDLIVGNSAAPNQQSDDKRDKNAIYRYNQVEVLTYYGNFYIDGKYYNDYVAVVVARNKLVYFQPRNIYTPGIYFYPYHAVGNGARGVSPLYYILDLCAVEQKTFNDAVDFIQLQKNPPKYAPVGFFEEEVTKMEPGKHITYKPGMQDPTAIIPIKFDANALAIFQASTEQLTQEIAGIDKGQLSVKSEALTQEEVKRIATAEDLIPNMIISGIMLNIVAKYLTDCIQIVDGAESEETLVKTAWEFANEQFQMQNIVGLLKEIGSNDPSMVKLQESARKAFETLGVNPDEYLNNGRDAQILAQTKDLPDEVLQQLLAISQQLLVKYNNENKARTMMGQVQDNMYRKALREGAEAGVMPEQVVVPDGARGQMALPVVPVTPETQTQNRTQVTA